MTVEMTVKEFCLMFNAQYVWVEGVKYATRLDKWRWEKELESELESKK